MFSSVKGVEISFFLNQMYDISTKMEKVEQVKDTPYTF